MTTTPTTPTAPRTPELVTQEIQREREQLAAAVSHLRSDLKAATNVKAVLRSKWPQLTAAVAFTAGVITARQLLRRRHERELNPVVRARFGRFWIVERP
jgi:hypothetical protein